MAHPEVQAEAQREIDEVVGTRNMPTLDDFARLPYLQAGVSEVSLFVLRFMELVFHVVLQTHRFRPLAPIAIPHAATADVRVSTRRVCTSPNSYVLIASSTAGTLSPKAPSCLQTYVSTLAFPLRRRT